MIDLPKDVLNIICDNLSYTDLNKFTQTCKSLNMICSNCLDNKLDKLIKQLKIKSIIIGIEDKYLFLGEKSSNKYLKVIDAKDITRQLNWMKFNSHDLLLDHIKSVIKSGKCWTLIINDSEF